ncbi:SIMPL domain-containing protein [Rufibacter sp. LB8]|uniref:SIMPL domain-containing protein n=1 Tax=Rufibacter sp. LB8 TaxID=2777781 RepID=UPI00178C3820|nr:SIMPL domain-containing protein [Rufibacter sp. LB8]
MNFKTTFLLLSLCLFSLTIFAQTNSNIGVAEEPKVSVVGYGAIAVFPNAAQITISLKFLKPALREAMNENQKVSQEVVDILKKYVADPNDIKVSLISTDKVMKYENSLKKEVLAGYEANQKIIFTLKDLAQMQNFTEEILKTRIYALDRVSYFHTDAALYTKQAQETAVIDARETTERLAKAGNLKLGKVLYLEINSSAAESINQTVDSFQMRTWGKGMGGQGVSSTGQLITYSAQVTMYTKIE